ncbi:hypothetical protein IAQ61_004065 [Plenodomus lingam]|nr:hypothetical protein IAQ61_004065 [Plenodomus lingam]
MVVSRKLIALAISCLPLQVTAHVHARQNEQPPADLLDRAIAALGINGNTTIQTIRVGGSQYRQRSVVQSASLKDTDSVVIPYGSQRLTYDYTGDALIQRVDSVHGLGWLMAFARPNLEPMDYSIVVRGGNNGFAAVVNGSYSVFAPTAPPEGLLDGYIAQVMIHDSYRWNPLLLQQIKNANNFTLRYETIEHALRMPAVHDQTTGLSVLIDPDTYLPHVIRAYENHLFFGESTNDLRVYDYNSYDGVMIPRKYKVIYNNDRFITDFLANDIAVNPQLEAGFFDAPNNITERNIPIEDPMATAQIVEQRASYIYFGRSNPTVADLSVTQPFPELPGVWVARLPENFRYRQILLEMDDHVIALDAPLDASALVIEWAEKTLGKPVKQVWPTHHHHDHSYGVSTYAQAGAEVVVVDFAQEYYAKVPGIKFDTYSLGKPYVAETKTFRATMIHIEGAMHAVDHSFMIITPPCPTLNSTTLIFDADHLVNVDLLPTANEAGQLEQFLQELAKHKVAKNAFLVPVHGSMSNMTALYDAQGYRYPNFTPLDFVYKKKECSA